MRQWNVSAFFPELRPAHMAYQHCVVVAGTIAVAARRGLIELLNIDGVKGKHIAIAKLTIVAFGKEKKEGE